MARLSATLATRIVAVVIAAHAVLLPLLFYVLLVVVEHSHAEMFVEHARTYARLLADEFELGSGFDRTERSAELLDSAIVSGDCVYAEIIDNGKSLKSSLSSLDVAYNSAPTLEFGKTAHGIYFVTLPIDRPGHSGELRLGFDERPTRDQITVARRKTIWLLVSFFVVSVLFAVIMSRILAKPVRQLQQNSRRIASGDYGQHLEATTGVAELQGLSTDLENMRKALVGVNVELLANIREKEESESRRLALEERLRRRQRLETVGTLAGGVAHEFNNALVPIMLYTDTAMTELPADSRAREDLGNVLRSARRARDIVQKVLTFSRQLGSEERRAVHLQELVAEALRLFTAIVPSNVEVASSIAPNCKAVLADANLIIQLVMNLCTNAYQAMRPDGGLLTVGLRSTIIAEANGKAPAGKYTELFVSDTGHGMDAATIERIFEPFFTTREVGEGTGLGLSVVHGIAETSGATIIVESAVGKGTTFRVLFQIAEPADVTGNIMTEGVSNA
jgi:signal transduction histidine kinase